ncbi:hypothetical protein V4F39_08215 [Aquincola sp. MAHUQ-54]|uniref:Uncharacterized protein n=1 Tax=Aquincola agrisoli TaxID=3119538 RepID=A0AAW9Q9E7_9BURK
MAAHSTPSAQPLSAATLRARLETIIALARLLEHVERSPGAASPSQYQQLVSRLTALLSDSDLPSDALDAVLSAHPASAELYENLHYEHSGLCRSPLDAAVAAETLAVRELARFTRRQTPGA